jgi:hypothetical protein
MEIDGDDIAEMDYGLEITNDSDNIKLEQNLTQLAHAALQNQTLSFSTIMKIFTSPSLVEIQRLIEKDEKETQARAADEADKQNKLAQQQMQMQAEIEDTKIDLAYKNLEAEVYGIDEKSRIEELKLIFQAEENEIQAMIDSENNGKDNGQDAKLKLDNKKHMDNLKLDIQKRADDMTKHNDTM